MSVCTPRGFVAAGIHAGIKQPPALDLALVATEGARPVSAAGVFTTNKMAAAPVVVSEGHLRSAAGEAAAVLLSSGNANAGTGEPGIEDASAMCLHTAAELGCDPHHVLVCSTGLIGFRLPISEVLSSVPSLTAALGPGGSADAAQAILTTDTRAKEVAIDSGSFSVGGMAKGAAMLAPNMATMLAVLTTDAEIEPALLRSALRQAVAGSFNELTVDGATSTNDTVIVLASGLAGPQRPRELEEALAAACSDLAVQMAEDAEGATKVVEVVVDGARSDDDAARAARKVAESQLVKCSWYGEDPYWGRVASELGSAGVAFDPKLLSISYGGVRVCAGGAAVPHDEAAVIEHMHGRRLALTCSLGLGTGRATVLTNDLTHAYIDENRGTS